MSGDPLPLVYLDDRTPYYHARADCRTFASTPYRAGELVVCLPERRARALGRLCCWWCAPDEETRPQ